VKLTDKRRIAMGLLLIGGLLVLISVVTTLNQQAERRRIEVKRPPASRPASLREPERSVLARYWLAAAGGLVVVFLMGTWAMVRFRRRMVALITAKPAPPTPSDDVWQMHKLPEDDRAGPEELDSDVGPRD
jgi:hypothetical protein